MNKHPKIECLLAGAETDLLKHLDHWIGQFGNIENEAAPYGKRNQTLEAGKKAPMRKNTAQHVKQEPVPAPRSTASVPPDEAG